MAYIRPDPASADDTFEYAQAYTRPDKDAANGTFQQYLVSGFKPTNFGTPKLAPIAVGFLATKFGTPIGKAPFYAFSLGPIIKFSWSQQVQAVGAAPRTRFGTPFATSTTGTVIGTIVLVSGFQATKFGTPIGAPPQTGVATGFQPIAFGQAAVRAGYTATGFVIPAFGSHTASYVVHPDGFVATQFGALTVRRTTTAASLGVRTRFGIPVADFPLGHKVTTISPRTRFGRPLVRVGQIQQATALGPVAAFGTPSTRLAHRVSSISPIIRAGKPALQRSTPC